MDDLVGDDFNVGEACMIAQLTATMNGWRKEPFAVIELLRGLA